MTKYERARRIYAIILGVFTVAVGIAVICVAADIYYSGKDTGVIYTRAIAAKRLQALAIPLIFLIAAVIAGAIFPLMEVQAKRKSEDAVKILQAKKPSGGEGEEYENAHSAYKQATKVRRIAWIAALAVVLAAAIAILCYLVQTSHFKGADITKEIFAMVKNVMPWALAALAALVAAAVVGGVFADRQLKALKTMIKYGNGETEQKTDPRWIAAAKAVAKNNITLWVVRGIVFAVAVTFIILGACNGGAHDVLVKAVNICQECIGLG